jgi:diaminopimelate epimerase
MTDLTIAFTKASGAGNDFVIIDNMQRLLAADKSALAVALCSRHFGVGADGLLVIEPSDRADFTMLYYNADGSYGGMCGNGGRCVARYAALKKIAHPSMVFEALGFLYHADLQGTAVRLRMRDPSNVRRKVLVRASGEEFSASFINTGSPHVVIFDEHLEERDILSTGRLIRSHTAFEPEGTNVNFVQLLGGDRIAMRTYERGVEAETLACGTGSVASALISSMLFGLRSPTHVRTRGGEDLHVEFQQKGDGFSEIVLLGSAHMLYSGIVRYSPQTKRIVDPAIETPHNPQDGLS